MTSAHTCFSSNGGLFHRALAVPTAPRAQTRQPLVRNGGLFRRVLAVPVRTFEQQGCRAACTARRRDHWCQRQAAPGASAIDLRGFSCAPPDGTTRFPGGCHAAYAAAGSTRRLRSGPCGSICAPPGGTPNIRTSCTSSFRPPCSPTTAASFTRASPGGCPQHTPRRRLHGLQAQPPGLPE